MGSTLTKVALLCAASCISSLALAQQSEPETPVAPALEAAPQARDDTDEMAGEIVVTARRREEALQDVPISVSALSGETLVQSGVQDVVGLQARVPSLSLTTQGTTRAELGYALRGQRSQESQLLTDPPVGTYFAEVVQARSIGFGNSLYDIQSIQVLKGVQGTLFGRNMTGGAVLVEPHHPELGEFSGELRGQYGNYDMRDLYGMLNLPLGDIAAVRIAGKTRQREGFTRDVSTGRDYDDQNYDTLRGSLRFEPTDAIESLTFVDWIRAREHGSALIPTAVDPAAPAIAAYASLTPLGVSNPVAEFARQQTLGKYRFDQGAGDGGRLDAYGLAPFERYRNIGVTNRTTFDLGDVTLKNIAGYRHIKFNQVMDLDGAPGFYINSNRFRNIKQYSEELQAQGEAFSNRLVYVLGGYYFLEKGVDGSTSSQFPELALAQAAFATGTFDPAVFFGTPASTFLNSLLGEGRAETLAGYAAGTYSLTDEFKLSAGLRYTEDKRRAAITASLPNLGLCLFRLADGMRAPFANCRQTNSESWDDITWDVTLQYEPSDDLTAYVSTRRGFRAGGFSLRAVSTAELEPFDPETVQEYEVGLKNRFALPGGSLSTNLAVFYQDYKNVQKQTSGIDTQGNVTTIIENTARQKNYGGEFEAALNVGRIDLSAFYSYVTVDITEGRQPGEFELVGSPHHQFGGNLSYEVPIPERLGELVLNANATYRGPQFLDKNDPQGREPGYALLNVRAAWDDIGGTGLGAALFMNNVTDEYYRVGVIGIFQEAGYISSTYGEPRTYGVELSYRF